MTSAGFRSAGQILRLTQRRRSARNERGQIVLMSALVLPVILGIAALAIDASFMYEKRNRLHAAADSAAKSAALEVRRGNTSGANLLAYAQREVIAQGFNSSVISAVNCPPTSGSYTGGTCGTTSSYVEVILQESTSTFFAKVLGFSSMSPRARAVAGASFGTTCMITLGTSGLGLDISNNANLNGPECAIAVNSASSPAVTVGNNGHVNVESVSITGSYSVGNNGSISPTPETATPPASDPLSGLAAPSVSSPCTTNGSPGTPYSLGNNASGSVGPGTYCGFNLANNATLTLTPGNYVISGGISIGNNSKVNGTGGVMIYNLSGILQLNNNSQLNIVAPTTGTWAGVGFFQPASNTQTINITNNGIYNVTGITYAPNGAFRVSNNGNMTGACSIIVALSVALANNAGTLASDCSTFGGNPLRSVAIAE